MKTQVEFRIAERAGRDALWGRALGRELRSEVEGLLDGLSIGGVLILQLESVEVMDFSFASELFGKLYTSLPTAYPGRAVILANPTDYVRENLNAALASLGLLVLVTKGGKKWDLIGKISETDRETLNVVALRKQATAPEIAEALNIKLTACNQRLRKLADFGAIVRTRISATSGGEQYLYSWPL